MIVAFAAGSDGQQSPSFKSDTDAVRVEVSVLRDRLPVSGLTADNFNLTDNGVVQTIDVVSTEEGPADLLLLLDVSGSIVGAKLAVLKKTSLAVVDSLREVDKLAVMSFSNAIRLVVPWSMDRVAARMALSQLEGSSRTALYDAVSAAIQLGGFDRPGVHVLLVTDGYDTASFLSPLVVLQQARRSDVIFHILRVGYEEPAGFARDGRSIFQRRELFFKKPELVPTEFLPSLVRDAGGELLDAVKHEQIEKLCVSIAQEASLRYILTYSPSRVEDHGWHTIDVSLRGTHGDVVARRGYQR